MSLSLSLPFLELLPTAIGVDVVNLGASSIGCPEIVKGFKTKIVCALDETAIVDFAIIIHHEEPFRSGSKCLIDITITGTVDWQFLVLTDTIRSIDYPVIGVWRKVASSFYYARLQ